MPAADPISVELEEVDGDTALVTIVTASGALEMVCALAVAARILYVRDAHVQGLAAGALGRAGLNAIARAIMEKLDVDGIVLDGATRTTGANRGQRPRTIRFPRTR